MSGPVRAAIVGCGRMGAHRLTATMAAGGRVVAICDPDERRVAECRGRCEHALVVAEPDALPWGDLDAVFVCTPPYLRGPVEERAVRAGVHLFVEKPVGVSAAQCHGLVAALRERPVITAAGYMNRYRPWMGTLRARLQGARLRAVTATWLGTKYRVPWWSRPGESGGAVNEQATHLVDLCRFLLGEIVEAHAIGLPRKSNPRFATGVGASLRFENDALASLVYSCEARTKLVDFVAYTETDRIHLVDWDFYPAHAATPPERPEPNAVFTEEVRAFFHAIETGDPSGIRSPIADAVRTQAVVDTILRSIESGHVEPVTTP